MVHIVVVCYKLRARTKFSLKLVELNISGETRRAACYESVSCTLLFYV